MKKALFITLKEVRDFIMDKGDLAFSLVLPVLIFALMYGAFGGSLQFNGTAYIVNEDSGGKYSTLLIQRLENYDNLTIQNLTASDADARLSRSNILLAIFIPQGFSDQLAANQPTRLVFKQRGNGGTEGQIVANLVQGVAEGIGQEIQVQNQVKSDMAASGLNAQQIEITVQQYIAQEASDPTIGITETNLGSSPDPINQFLPGIMTMFVLFAVNLTAETLVNERRKGTLERLLATRLKIGELFTGKFLAYMGRGFIQTTVLLLLAYAVFFRIALPHTLWQWLALCVTLSLSLLISFAWRFLLNLTAFWTPDARGIGRVGFSLSWFLSGFLMRFPGGAFLVVCS